MKKILFVLLALALVSAGLYAYRVTDVDFYGTKTGSSVGTTGTGGSGSGYDGDAYGPNVAASGGAGGAAGAGSGSGGGGDDDLGPGGNLGEGQTVKEALADCMKNDDGKARGICLSKLHKDGKPIDSTVSMTDIAKGCKGVGDNMPKYPNNCVAGTNQNSANLAYKENYLECCVWAKLGKDTKNRKTCCESMDKLGCINYYKGSCPEGKNTYMYNACPKIPDPNPTNPDKGGPWCGDRNGTGENGEIGTTSTCANLVGQRQFTFLQVQKAIQYSAPPSLVAADHAGHCCGQLSNDDKLGCCEYVVTTGGYSSSKKNEAGYNCCVYVGDPKSSLRQKCCSARTTGIFWPLKCINDTAPVWNNIHKPPR